MTPRGTLWLAGAVGAFVTTWLIAGNFPSDSPSTRVVRDRVIENASVESVEYRQLHSEPAGSVPTRLLGTELESAVARIAPLSVTMESGDVRSVAALFEFAERIASEDFPAVLAMLAASGKDASDPARAELLGYWLERDFEKAQAYFTSLTAKDRERFLGKGREPGPVLDALARIGPDGLLTWLKGLPAAEQRAIRDRVRMAVGSALSPFDPSMAVTLLLDSAEDKTTTEAGWAEITVFSDWAQKDPLAAAERAMKLPGGDGRIGVFRFIMNAWIDKDLDAALEWIRELEAPEEAHEAAIAAAEMLATRDPAAAVKLTMEMGATDASIRGRAVSAWVRKDLPAAVQWAEALVPGPAREAVWSDVISAVSENQPQHAAELFLKESAKGNHLSSAAPSLVYSLAKADDMGVLGAVLLVLPEEEQSRAIGGAPFFLRDALGPRGLMERGMQLPPGAVRDQWLDESLEQIARGHPNEVLQAAVAAIPAGENRQRVAEQAVKAAFGATARRLSVDPESALAMATALNVKREHIVLGLSAWANGEDRTAALQWIERTSHLTEDEKEGLLQPSMAAHRAAPSLPASDFVIPAGQRFPRP